MQETHTVPSHTPRASDQSNVPIPDCERNQEGLKPSLLEENMMQVQPSEVAVEGVKELHQRGGNTVMLMK